MGLPLAAPPGDPREVSDCVRPVIRSASRGGSRIVKVRRDTSSRDCAASNRSDACADVRSLDRRSARRRTDLREASHRGSPVAAASWGSHRDYSMLAPHLLWFGGVHVRPADSSLWRCPSSSGRRLPARPGRRGRSPRRPRPSRPSGPRRPSRSTGGSTTRRGRASTPSTDFTQRDPGGGPARDRAHRAAPPLRRRRPLRRSAARRRRARPHREAPVAPRRAAPRPTASRSTSTPGATASPACASR